MVMYGTHPSSDEPRVGHRYISNVAYVVIPNTHPLPCIISPVYDLPYLPLMKYDPIQPLHGATYPSRAIYVSMCATRYSVQIN